VILLVRDHGERTRGRDALARGYLARYAALDLSALPPLSFHLRPP
jgi:hypothetical protein